MNALLDEYRKNAVWGKGHVIADYDPRVWRRDEFGNAIKYSEYGASTQYGWEIDHIKAVALGGSDDLSNLRPLHHSANSALGGRLGGLLGRR